MNSSDARAHSEEKVRGTRMASTYDAIFVGSGISSLIGASILAKAGWSVGVFERNSWLGGNIRSCEITEPGFIHDLYSAWHPLFVAGEGYKLLKTDLAARRRVSQHRVSRGGTDARRHCRFHLD